MTSAPDAVAAREDIRFASHGESCAGWLYRLAGYRVVTDRFEFLGRRVPVR